MSAAPAPRDVGAEADVPAAAVAAKLARAADDAAIVPIDHIYACDQIVEAHTDMEAGRARGKLVAITRLATSLAR